MSGLRDQGSAAIGNNSAFAFHSDMCYLSAATVIGLSWQCQFAELRSVQQTTTEPLSYVSFRRRKESRPPLPQLLLQSTQQQLLLKNDRRSAGVDSCDDDGE
jgi:hypothetical protein